MTADLTANDDPDALAPAASAEDERALGWTVSVVAVITLLLALFSAASMRSWAENLPPTPTNLVIRQSAEQWYDVTERLGLAAPRASLREAWSAAREARFDAAAAAPRQDQR